MQRKRSPARRQVVRMPRAGACGRPRCTGARWRCIDEQRAHGALPIDADAPLQPQLAKRAAWRAGAGVVLVLGLLPVAAWLALRAAVVGGGGAGLRQGRPGSPPGAARRRRHGARGAGARRPARARRASRCWCWATSSVDADMNRLNYRVEGRARQPGAARGRADAGARRSRFPPDVVAAASGRSARWPSRWPRRRALFAARRDALVGQVALLRAQRDKVAQESAALRAQIAQAGESMQAPEGRARDQPPAAQGRLHLGHAHLAARGDRGRLRRQARGAALRAGARRAAPGRHRPAHQVAGGRIPPAGERPAQGDRCAAVGDPAGAAQDQRRVDAPGHRRAGRRRRHQPEVHDARRGGVAARDRSPTSCRTIRGWWSKRTSAPRTSTACSRARRPRSASPRSSTARRSWSRARCSTSSPDRLVDRATNQPYYVALVEADPASLAQAGELKLQAGMPAEVYIKGEQRTPLQYLVEPVTQVLRRAGARAVGRISRSGDQRRSDRCWSGHRLLEVGCRQTTLPTGAVTLA